MSQIADIEVHPMRWRLRLSHGVNQGKIHTQLVLQLSRMFYKSALFMQNKANFRKSQMDVNLIMTREYEKKSKRTLGENKAKQSQSAIGGQVSENRGLPASSGIEDGGRKIDDRRRITENERRAIYYIRLTKMGDTGLEPVTPCV